VEPFMDDAESDSVPADIECHDDASRELVPIGEAELTLDELAKAIDATIGAGRIALLTAATLLYEARTRFPSNQAFHEWLAQNNLGEDRLSHQARAALVNIGEHMNVSRDVLRKTARTSPELIWQKEVKPLIDAKNGTAAAKARVTSTRKTADAAKYTPEANEQHYRELQNRNVENAKLRRECEQLKAHVAELEAARENVVPVAEPQEEALAPFSERLGSMLDEALTRIKEGDWPQLSETAQKDRIKLTQHIRWVRNELVRMAAGGAGGR
jgi:hypothetical protein